MAGEILTQSLRKLRHMLTSLQRARAVSVTCCSQRSTGDFTLEAPEVMPRSSAEKAEEQLRQDAEEYERFRTNAMRDLATYDYPFENLVFEGGGTKGIAYSGAVEVLDELGVLGQVKRYGGASAGAMMAALLAVGYSPAEVRAHLAQSLSPYFQDTPMMYYPSNLFMEYGIHKAAKLTRYLRNLIGDKTGNPDLTFWDLFKSQGVELCVVVTNLNQMVTEYCHPKTTPDRPIADALRMSMAIPIVFRPVLHKDEYTGQWDYYVDGGVLCNYPIHCFDGWWLSMKEEDAIFHKITPFRSAYKRFENSDRFGLYNHRTLGLTLFAADEQEPYKEALERRNKAVPSPVRPHTALARRAIEREKKEWLDEEIHGSFEAAAEKFFDLLAMGMAKDGIRPSVEMSRGRLLEMINKVHDSAEQDDGHFSREDFEILFGSGTSLKDLLVDVDANSDDKIDFYEIVNYMERRGLRVTNRYQCFPRAKIAGIADFFNTLMSAMMLQSNRATFQGHDVQRTIGLNTDYVYGLDFSLTADDKDYLFERGRWAALAYLDYYVKKFEPPKKQG